LLTQQKQEVEVLLAKHLTLSTTKAGVLFDEKALLFKPLLTKANQLVISLQTLMATKKDLALKGTALVNTTTEWRKVNKQKTMAVIDLEDEKATMPEVCPLCGGRMTNDLCC
jgi:hypothetical protein